MTSEIFDGVYKLLKEIKADLESSIRTGVVK